MGEGKGGEGRGEEGEGKGKVVPPNVRDALTPLTIWLECKIIKHTMTNKDIH